MLALKLDAVFNRIILLAGAANVALAFFLAPKYGPMGMATSVVFADALVTAGTLLAFRKRRRHPWTAPNDNLLVPAQA